jgi:outer membrane autotransporter protein
MFVEQGGFNSIVGELGVGMGKRFERGTVFTKFALAHEFAGDFSANFMDSNSRIVKSDADFGGSWYEWQLGGSVKVNDNSYVYATYEKTFGGDAARDWRVDAGVRWTF